MIERRAPSGLYSRKRALASRVLLRVSRLRLRNGVGLISAWFMAGCASSPGRPTAVTTASSEKPADERSTATAPAAAPEEPADAEAASLAKQVEGALRGSPRDCRAVWASLYRLSNHTQRACDASVRGGEREIVDECRSNRALLETENTAVAEACPYSGGS